MCVCVCVCTVLSGRINDSAFVRIVCVRARVGAGWDGCAPRERQNDNKRQKKKNIIVNTIHSFRSESKNILKISYLIY